MKDYIGMVLVVIGMVMLFSTLFYWLFMLSPIIGFGVFGVFITMIGFAICEIIDL